jgi:1,4-alpha-glucan branching enzyme
MKAKALLTVIPILLLAFNYENKDEVKTFYFQSLKFIKNSELPERVKMIRTDHTGGVGKMIEEGILFSYKNRGAKQVHVSGNFSGWKLLKMMKSENGIWYYFLSLNGGGQNIVYKFLVDGHWIMDPQNPDRIDDGMGSYLSTVETFISSEGKRVTYRSVNKNMVEFRIYQPKASFVSLVGDFNYWNPENDLLAKGKDGIWRLQKKLYPGKYRYKYIIDGEWVPDTYNSSSGSDNSGEICSVIEISK